MNGTGASSVPGRQEAASPLSRIVYLDVPESLRGQMESSAAFEIDPSIPIPAEIPPGEERLPVEQLSWEMIVSGMIRVVTARPEGEHADYYRRFISVVKPSLLDDFFNAAVIKAESGSFEIAAEIAEALRAVYPHSPRPYMASALVAERRGDAALSESLDDAAEAYFDEAASFYQSAAAETPPLPAVFFNAAYFYMKRGHFSRALSLFNEFLACTDEAEDDEVIGGQRETAQRMMKEITSRSLDDELFLEAYNLVRQGDAQKGLEKIKVFLERHTDVWNGWFLLGWALRKLGRWEDGVRAFHKCLELGGEGADTRNELAICYLENGDLRAARREAEQALLLDPDSVKVISNLGVIALRAGNREEARGFFRTVLEIDPNDPLAITYFADETDGAGL
jgi:tetratricopeptide (TPR) repeat protein